ncbi:hypothetical protein [Novipirellula galeiformis]|uniref:hypothetical protein n=1 Tax=Novipirellula galeiformis TaxID=2528004 RepID=UPI0011B3D376|nr:hypothetical protein [Novipirellula galeiformis]
MKLVRQYGVGGNYAGNTILKHRPTVKEGAVQSYYRQQRAVNQIFREVFAHNLNVNFTGNTTSQLRTPANTTPFSWKNS